MKLASYRTRDGDDYGIVVGSGLVSLRRRVGGGPSLRDILTPSGLDEVRELAESAAPDVAIDDVEFLPVVPNPDKILAVGINYVDHAAETARSVAPSPSFFARFADTLTGHRSPIVRPPVSTQFDYEGELAVVIGTGGRYIDESTALEHVAGYTCFLDGSVRDYQKSSVTAGKNFPSTGPLGPWLVTADEIPDPGSLTLTTRLNGTVMQHAGLDAMIHPVPALISYASQFTRLAPGDVIATGTPGGVGHRRTPPVWMKAGDRVEVEISRIGTLVAEVVDER